MKGNIIEVIKDIHNIEDVYDNPTFYLYDMNDIKHKVSQIEKNAFDNINLYYAMKANPHVGVVEYMKSLSYVKGIEIASSGELNIANQVYEGNQILFTGPGKTEKEIEKSMICGIKYFNVESLVEAYRISMIANKLGINHIDILVRINIDYCVDGADEYMAGISTKMGIDQKEIISTIKKIKKLGNLNIKGIHAFSASGILDYNYLIKYAEYVFNLTAYLENQGLKINVIDFGGGLGIDYTNGNKQFDVKSYFEKLYCLVDKTKNFDKEIIMELGKYLVGESGYYITRILDIKDIKNYKHIVTAGGVNHMRLPIATDRKHPVHIIELNGEKLFSTQPEVKNEYVDIEGPLCMNEDKISWDEYIEKASVGDLVVLRQAGAYCYSASTLRFLSHDLPKEFLKKGDEIYEQDKFFEYKLTRKR